MTIKLINLWYKIRFYFLPKNTLKDFKVPNGMVKVIDYNFAGNLFSTFNKWFSDVNEPMTNVIPKLDCIQQTEEGISLFTRVNIDKKTQKEFNFKSGRLSTKGKFTQQYGRFDLVCKLPENEGMFWAAWWMYGTWPPEIDIFEAMYNTNYTKETKHISTTHHWGTSGNDHYQLGRRIKSRHDLSKEYHRYGIEWNEKSLTWLFDDYPIYKVTKDIPQIPMHLVINTAIAGGVTVDMITGKNSEFKIKQLIVCQYEK